MVHKRTPEVNVILVGLREERKEVKHTLTTIQLGTGDSVCSQNSQKRALLCYPCLTKKWSNREITTMESNCVIGAVHVSCPNCSTLPSSNNEMKSSWIESCL